MSRALATPKQATAGGASSRTVDSALSTRSATPPAAVPMRGQPTPAPGVCLSVVQKALEASWTSIRRTHPELPAALVVVGTAGRLRESPGSCGWSTDRWSIRGQGDAAEVHIPGEALTEGGGPVLLRLLHRAAHGLASARSLRDTSRQFRFHNGHFRDLAVEVGLLVERTKLGWADVSIPRETTQRYRSELDLLTDALCAWRLPEASERKPRVTPVLECQCQPPRPLHLRMSEASRGPVQCGLCGSPFEPPVCTAPLD